MNKAMEKGFSDCFFQKLAELEKESKVPGLAELKALLAGIPGHAKGLYGKVRPHLEKGYEWGRRGIPPALQTLGVAGLLNLLLGERAPFAHEGEEEVGEAGLHPWVLPGLGLGGGAAGLLLLSLLAGRGDEDLQKGAGLEKRGKIIPEAIPAYARALFDKTLPYVKGALGAGKRAIPPALQALGIVGLLDMLRGEGELPAGGGIVGGMAGLPPGLLPGLGIGGGAAGLLLLALLAGRGRER